MTKYELIKLHYGKDIADEFLIRDSRTKRPKLKSSKKKASDKKKSKQYKKNKSKLHIKAKELELNLPLSEKWFRDLYEMHFKHRQDQYNHVFHSKYIADVFNKKFKYVIEIDGSYHLLPEQIIRDQKKDEFYKYSGYSVFRVIAYDNQSYINTIEAIAKIRAKCKLRKEFFEFKSNFLIDSK